MSKTDPPLDSDKGDSFERSDGIDARVDAMVEEQEDTMYEDARW